MAQDGTTAGGSSYTIDNVTFPVGRTKLQSIFDAIRSTNIGNTAPDLVAGQFWIDNNTPSTTVWTLYLYDGTDNISFATIDTINNTVNFLDSTFDLINDTTPQLGGDLSSNGNNINFGDNDKAQFGAGNDLQIYHDGSNSKIKELGTGQLILDSNGAGINFTKSDAEYMARMYTDGAVELYYDNSKKIETTSSGIDVTGNLTASGNLTSLGIDDNATSTAITIDSSENVGIGTASILKPLHLRKDNSGNSETLLLLHNNGSGDGTEVEIRLAPTSYPRDIGNVEDGGVARWSSIRATRDGAGNGTTMSFLTNQGGATPTERIRINSFGNVGIGTSSPSQKLDIDTGHINFSNNYGIDWGGNNSVRGSATDNRINFRTNGSERMRIDSSGNVGIGTSSPSTSLHISQSVPIITLTDTDIGASHQLSGQSGSRHLNLKVDTGGSSGSPVFNLSMQDNIKLSVLNSGNVGIGTTSPTTKLDIVGTGVNGIELGQQSDNTANSSRLFFNNSTNIWTAYSTTGNFKIASGATIGTSSGTDRLVIDSSGNIGIGTSSPSSFTYAPQLVVGSGSATNNGITIYSSASTGIGRLHFADGTIGISQYDGYLVYAHATPTMQFGVGGTERMRIDSSGNLLVGKTTSSYATDGITLNPEAILSSSNTSQISGIFNRNSTDGDIVHIRKDGTTVGSIGVFASDNIYLSGNSSHAGIQFGSESVLGFKNGSITNNTLDLGNGTAQWRDLYLGGGLYVGGTGTANKLDDYEEGTWTPTLSGTTTGSALQGWYRKVGSLVTVTAILTNHTLSSSSGIAKITNLPFTITSALRGGAGVLGYNNSTTSSSNGGIFSQNTTEFVLYNSGTISTATFVDGSTKYFIMTGSYITD